MAFAVLACLFLTCGIKASAQTAYVVVSDNQTKLTFYYDSNKPESTEETPVFEVNDGTSPNWNITIHEGNNIIRHPYPDINTVVFDKSFANFKPTTCNDWFWGMTKLTTIQGIEYLNTEDVTDTYRMFEDCSSLTSIDLSHFNTAKVTNMGEMFMGCSSLTSIDVKTFNTENVENMNNMFDGCSSLISLDLSSFNTAKLQLLTKMFKGCTNLRAIFASKSFELKNLEVLLPQEYEAGWNYDVFKDCESLVGAIAYDSEKTDITYANYSTGYFLPTNTPYAIYDNINKVLTFKVALEGENVPTNTYQYTAFLIPSKIEISQDVPWMKKGPDPTFDVETVVFDESFKYARPTTCAFWFSSRQSLKNIENLEYLNTSCATSMRCMFENTSLSSLDLSTFDTKNVTDMSNMFDVSKLLSEIKFSSRFNTSNVTNMSNMFRSCQSIQTLDLSSFTTDNVTNMIDMFHYCNIKYILIGTFNVPKDDLFAQQIFDNSSTKTLVYTTPGLYKKNNIEDFGYANYIQRLQIYSPINTKAEYGTICIPQGCDLQENDYSGFDKLYKVSKITSNGTNDVVSLTQVTKMKPGEAYIFHRSKEMTSDVEGAITFRPNSDKENMSPVDAQSKNGTLQGTFDGRDFGGWNNTYILQSDGKFHLWSSKNKLGANRAYLIWNGSANANMLTLSFDDIETGIKGVTENTTEDNAPVYDLMGRRVSSMVKGNVYLKNGKKFVF